MMKMICLSTIWRLKNPTHPHTLLWEQLIEVSKQQNWRRMYSLLLCLGIYFVPYLYPQLHRDVGLWLLFFIDSAQKVDFEIRKQLPCNWEAWDFLCGVRLDVYIYTFKIFINSFVLRGPTIFAWHHIYSIIIRIRRTSSL